MKEIYRVYKIEPNVLDYKWFEITEKLDGFKVWGDYNTEEEAMQDIKEYGEGEFFIQKVYLIKSKYVGI